MSVKQHYYFPNLDAWRFFAFFYVFMFHCYYDIPEPMAGSDAYAFLHFIWSNGDLGVNFFFTLSGFLITYLLIREEEDLGRIGLKAFYMRRVLRIWPLYYFTFFFGYFIFYWLIRSIGAQVEETANPWYYVFFAGNFNSIINGDPTSGTLSVLWSIAIEEQFYLAWPVLLILFKNNRPALFLSVIALSLAFRLFHLGEPKILFFHTLSVMSDLAVGAWLGWWAASRKVGPIHFPRAYTLLIYAVGLGLMLFRKELFVAGPMVVSERLVFSLFFAFFLLEQCYFSNPLFRAGNLKWPGYWGKYTYGLYCLHLPAMVFTVGIAMILSFDQAPAWNLYLKAITALLLSMAFSWLSYRYLEKPFLQLKARFSPARHAPANPSL